jgi:hypothetical protein
MNDTVTRDQGPTDEGRSKNVNGKKSTKKKGTLRPWLVDVSLDHLR